MKTKMPTGKWSLSGFLCYFCSRIPPSKPQNPVWKFVPHLHSLFHLSFPTIQFISEVLTVLLLSGCRKRKSQMESQNRWWNPLNQPLYTMNKYFFQRRRKSACTEQKHQEANYGVSQHRIKCMIRSTITKVARLYLTTSCTLVPARKCILLSTPKRKNCMDIQNRRCSTFHSLHCKWNLIY